jgi:hypothetical protein
MRCRSGQRIYKLTDAVSRCRLLGRPEYIQYDRLNAGLGAVYGPLVRHMLPVSLYHKDVNVFQRTVILKHPNAGQELKLKPHRR